MTVRANESTAVDAARQLECIAREAARHTRTPLDAAQPDGPFTASIP